MPNYQMGKGTQHLMSNVLGKECWHNWHKYPPQSVSVWIIDKFSIPQILLKLSVIYRAQSVQTL